MMSRKALALAILLLIGGLAPASSIIGFCTRMPCCSHSAAQPISFSSAATDCCTTITCYDVPSAKLTHSVVASGLAHVVAVVRSSAAAPLPDLHMAATIAETRPVTTQHRLAILSTLLI